MENHCFRKSNYLESHEDFQFILEEALLSESMKDIPKNVEKLVKAEGFLESKEMDVHANITIQCQGNGEWIYAEEKRFK